LLPSRIRNSRDKHYRTVSRLIVAERLICNAALNAATTITVGVIATISTATTIEIATLG